MSDLISRQAAIDAVKDAIIEAEWEYAENAIKAVPSAQSEQKKGKWMWQEDRREVTGNDWYCSECGNGIRYRDHYCPNCGTKMEVERE